MCVSKPSACLPSLSPSLLFIFLTTHISLSLSLSPFYFAASGANATIYYTSSVDEALEMLDFVVVVIRRLSCSEIYDQTVLEEIAGTAKCLFSAFSRSIRLAGFVLQGKWVVNPAVLSVDQLMEFFELALEIELSIGVSHHSLDRAGAITLYHYTFTAAFTAAQKHSLVYMFHTFAAHNEMGSYSLPGGVLERLSSE